MTGSLEGIDTIAEILQQLCGLLALPWAQQVILVKSSLLLLWLSARDKHGYSVSQYNYAAKPISQVEVSSPSIEVAGPQASTRPSSILHSNSVLCLDISQIW